MTPPPRHNGERIDPALHDLFLFAARDRPSDFSTGFVLAFPCRALVICRTLGGQYEPRFFRWQLSCQRRLPDFFSLPVSYYTLSVSTS